MSFKSFLHICFLHSSIEKVSPSQTSKAEKTMTIGHLALLGIKNIRSKQEQQFTANIRSKQEQQFTATTTIYKIIYIIHLNIFEGTTHLRFFLLHLGASCY